MLIRRPRRAGLNLAWLAFLASLLLFVGLSALLWWNPTHPNGPGPAGRPLHVYCAAAMKGPVETAARDYERDHGVEIQLQFGGSQTLLAQVEVARRADLYLPADDSFLDLARTKGLLAEVLPLARMTPVLVVQKGNPRHIGSFDDLLQGKGRIAQATPEAAAIGKLAREALEKAGLWEQWHKRVTVYKPTVTDVANDVQLGAVDAGIVWDATVRQIDGLEAVPARPLEGLSAHVSAAVLTCSSQPTAALRFARYLAARDRGLPLFQKAGFVPAEGDPWAETPEIRLFSGAMLRPAIEQTINAFEEREGVKVTRVYNGCGILVAQMRSGNKGPDAYFACDTSFMKEVHDLFLDPVDVSMNQLVIMVPKGNPHNIRGLKDLGKPGLRVGVGHEKQCALGALTQKTLAEGSSKIPDLQAEVMKNVKVQSPTGDLLVNQMRTGSLDAIIAYISNKTEAGDALEAIAIDIPCALAVQPLALGKEATYKQLTGRLLEALRSQGSRQQFEKAGFRWQLAGKQP
jgi:molybdenum ABC transporter molybdate-binding protein